MKLRRVVRNLAGTSLKAWVDQPDGYIEEVDFNWLNSAGVDAGVPDVWYEAITREAAEADRRRRKPGRDIYDIVP